MIVEYIMLAASLLIIYTFSKLDNSSSYLYQLAAHWGPAFLPWHREFLRQYESALRKEVAGVALPYWDSTLDEGQSTLKCLCADHDYLRST